MKILTIYVHSLSYGCHGVANVEICQISSKSDDLSLRCGDLTTCNMAAVCHHFFGNLEFLLPD